MKELWERVESNLRKFIEKIRQDYPNLERQIFQHIHRPENVKLEREYPFDDLFHLEPDSTNKLVLNLSSLYGFLPDFQLNEDVFYTLCEIKSKKFFISSLIIRGYNQSSFPTGWLDKLPYLEIIEITGCTIPLTIDFDMFKDIQHLKSMTFTHISSRVNLTNYLIK